MKRKYDVPVNISLLPKGQQEKIFKSFFEYMMDHACVCGTQWCICKASTFQDTICEPALRNDPKYSRTIEEILNRK